MHVQAQVAFGGEFRLARVQTHADAYHHAFRPAMASQGMLPGYRCGDSIAGTRKSHEEAIPLRIDLVPVPLLEARSQQVSALCQDMRVALT
jgi:hypothetical protein